jgi:formate hydrogenlyase subunit 6/NADH:ubiquinone oxidoreductase subunit I
MVAPAPKTGQADRGYFGSIASSAKSIFEGMAVTFSYLFKEPITVQYPDRLSVPLCDTLPERYRGFLEVDMSVCTGCLQCQRDCPIDCITIESVKEEAGRFVTRFDIDLGKCMYCGLCVEACPVDTMSPGDTEAQKTIRFTREFEGTSSDFPALTYRFVKPGDKWPFFKPPKGQNVPSRRRGEIAREARRFAHMYNALAVEVAKSLGPAKKKDALAGFDEVVRAEELKPIIEPVKQDVEKMVDVLYTQSLAQTDCEACGWPTCKDYARAMLTGKDHEWNKCEPGGDLATANTTLILNIRIGKGPAPKSPAPPAPGAPPAAPAATPAS